MAIDSFWTESGRVDVFEFWTVAIADPSGPKVDNITQYVQEATLSFSDFTHNETGGSFKFTNRKKLFNNCYVRIIYKPYIPHLLDDNGKPKTKTVTIATMYAETSDAHYEDGIWSGTTKLRSVMCRYTDDKLAKPFNIAKGADLKKLFKYVMKGGKGGKQFGSGPYDYSAIANRKSPSSKTIKFGEGVDEVVAELASRLNATVSISPMGKIVLTKKLAYKDRPNQGKLPTGKNSVIKYGIDKSYTGVAKTNRAVLKGSYTTKNSKKETVTKYVYSSYAPTGKSWTYDKCGRYITESYEKNWGGVTKSKAQAANNKHVKTKVKTATTTKFEINSMYMPIELGQVWTFEYEGISKKVAVSHIDMTFKETLKMKTALRVVG